jgi:hypothetical protein
MTFDLPAISALVRRLSARLVPGWTITCALAKPGDLPPGALAMVDPLPERQSAHIIVAPHPPSEDYEETIAHELTHVMLSPIVQLVKRSSASVMLEEQIVERIGKLLVNATSNLRRAVVAAVSNPRTASPEVRFRISALASGRLGKGKRRMMTAEQAQKALDALVAGDSEAAMAVLKEMIAGAMSGGGGDGPESAAMREEEPEEKPAPAMREDEVPAPMRESYRRARATEANLLATAIRLRLFEARTAGGITLDAETEHELSRAKTLDQFEREFKLVTRQAAKGNERTRQRSGVVTEESTVGGALKFDDLVKEGIPTQQARDLVELSAKNRAAADAELSGARIRLRQMGGAK